MKTLDLRTSFAPLTGLQSLKRRVEERVRLRRGEWIYRINSGLPVDDVIREGGSIGLIGKIFTDEISTVPEVDAVEIINTEYDPQTRKATFEMQIESRYGPFTMTTGGSDGSS